VNLLLNLWWIPVYGWIGAAWSSLASDGLLAAANSVLVFELWRRIRSRTLNVTSQSAGGVGHA
jgi:O-antigen/teichoic acid export membrane protein